MAEEPELERAPGDPEHEALAASLPDEWVRAAESWYSMHGSGLVRNILAGAVPLIRAAEQERIAAECEARAAYPGSTRIQKAAFLAAAAVARGEYTPISERRSGGYDSSFDGPVL